MKESDLGFITGFVTNILHTKNKAPLRRKLGNTVQRWGMGVYPKRTMVCTKQTVVCTKQTTVSDYAASPAAKPAFSSLSMA